MYADSKSALLTPRCIILIVLVAALNPKEVEQEYHRTEQFQDQGQKEKKKNMLGTACPCHSHSVRPMAVTSIATGGVVL